jgi:hypothetical protein
MVPAVPHHVPQLSNTPTKAPVRVDKHIQGAPVELPPRGAVFNPVTGGIPLSFTVISMYPIILAYC